MRTSTSPLQRTGPGDAPGEPARRTRRGRARALGTGPGALPAAVLERVREALLDFRGMGAGILEISHRSPQFGALLEECDALLTRLLGLPAGWRILYTHGGRALQPAYVALNLLALRPARTALVVEGGPCAAEAAAETARFGTVHTVRTAAPEAAEPSDAGALQAAAEAAGASYVHVTACEPETGTALAALPGAAPSAAGAAPLVADLTGELLCRPFDPARCALAYAGGEAGLAAPGLAVVLVREELLGHALPATPALMDFAVLARQRSLVNTPSTFAVLVLREMLAWAAEAGGVAALAAAQETKARAVYAALEASGICRPLAAAERRSRTAAAFEVPDAGLRERLLAGAAREGFAGLETGPGVATVRAGLGLGLTTGDAQALAGFLADFARRHG